MAGNPTNHIHTLLSSLHTLQSTLDAESSAWAHRVRTAQKSYLAAVMGPALTQSCRESDEWDASQGIAADPVLSEEIRKARSAAPDLQHAIRCHMQWLMQEIEKGVCEAIRTADPNFDPDTDHAHAVAWSRAQANHESTVQA